MHIYYIYYIYNIYIIAPVAGRALDIHASYTPHTRLMHASYINASYTPHTRLIHASYTPGKNSARSQRSFFFWSFSSFFVYLPLHPPCFGGLARTRRARGALALAAAPRPPRCRRLSPLLLSRPVSGTLGTVSVVN